MDEQRLEWLERAQFGKEVELFWSSRIGAYLRERARACYSEAIEQLKVCDPTDTKRIVRLQADIFKSEEFEHWLSDALLDGLKSLDLLEGEPADE